MWIDEWKRSTVLSSLRSPPYLKRNGATSAVTVANSPPGQFASRISTLTHMRFAELFSRASHPKEGLFRKITSASKKPPWDEEQESAEPRKCVCQARRTQVVSRSKVRLFIPWGYILPKQLVQVLADVIAQSRALCPPQRRFKRRSLVRTCVFNFSDSDLVRALLDYAMQFSKAKPSKWRHWRITLHGRRVKNEYLWNITFRREFVAMMEKWNAQTTSLCVSFHPSPSPDLPTYKNQTGS